MSHRQWWLIASVGVILLALVSLLSRPLIPVDETRYITVAWEMWDRGQFLVPYLNGEFYDHKPPALFWLMHAGWAITGVNEWWPRLIGPLATLLCLWLLMRLGSRLWPERPGIGRVGALMFLSIWFIAFYQTALMFDMPLLAAVAWAWLSLVNASRTGLSRHWLGFAAALGTGLLVKGPVVFVYTLPVALAIRWWAPVDAPRFVRTKALWIALVAVAIPGLWLAAAWWDGSGDYFRKLLLDQTVSRVSGEMGHPRPWYWYLPLLVLLPFPWTLWWPAWRAMGKTLGNLEDRSNRFLVVSMGATLLVLSLVGGKQVHYLIPLLAMLSLALSSGLHLPRWQASRLQMLFPALFMSPLILLIVVVAGRWAGVDLRAGLAEVPWWSLLVLTLIPMGLMLSPQRDPVLAARRLGLASLVFCAMVMAVVFPIVRPIYDLSAAGEYIGHQQLQGRPIIYVGNYQGEFGFFGRLRLPVVELPPALAERWIREHPDGLVVSRLKRLRLEGEPRPEYQQRYKTDTLLMFEAAELVSTGSGLREPTSNEY